MTGALGFSDLTCVNAWLMTRCSVARHHTSEGIAWLGAPYFVGPRVRRNVDYFRMLLGADAVTKRYP